MRIPQQLCTVLVFLPGKSNVNKITELINPKFTRKQKRIDQKTNCTNSLQETRPKNGRQAAGLLLGARVNRQDVARITTKLETILNASDKNCLIIFLTKIAEKLL
jgi:hypothetical protein